MSVRAAHGSMTGRVEGKVALVTGGAGGIGAAAARLLAREGARVAVTDLAEGTGASLAEEIGGAYLSQDVTDEARWAETVAEVERRFGGLHVLVNAAGIEGDVSAGTPEDTSLDEWRRVLAVNLDGTFLGCRAAIPAIRRAGGGSIVNISSIVALFATPNSTAYGASKAGVRQLTKSVAFHGAAGSAKVRCNSVHPGLIRTRMLDSIHATRAQSRGISFEDSRALSLSRVPMGALGEPEDVAWTILFLASEESRYVTGAEFHIDGGWNLT